MLAAWLHMARLALVVTVKHLVGRHRCNADRLTADGIQALRTPGHSLQIE
jgi:hypothetical protein